MKRLWAPWRLQYIHGKRGKGCVFCRPRKFPRDNEDHILYRGKENFVILNKYPYNNGHLMVIPYRHVSDPTRLSEEESREMFLLLNSSLKVLKKAFRPEGFNVGMNLGRVAGQGILGHLHLHVVPRWESDTNFMPVLSESKSLPEHLTATHRRLKKIWRSS